MTTARIFRRLTNGGATCALAALALALAAVPAVAQPSVDVSFGRAVNSLNQTDDATSRQTTAASVTAEHHVADERLRLFYSLDAGNYNTPGDWTYYLHTAGATWRTAKPASSQPTLFTGASLSWRANGSSWAAANYRALGAFANLEWRPRQTVTLRSGYRLDLRDFPDSVELNQREHSVFGSALANLPTRTTLIGEVRFGAKSYTSPVTLAAGGVTVPTYAGTGQAQTGGQSRGMGPAYRTAALSGGAGAVMTAGSGGTARLVTLMGRVAQSLADRTGASLQYTRRMTFGALPSAIVTTPALFFDDGIYDDPFASDAGIARATVKHVFAGGAEVEASGAWLTKDYRGTVALGLDGLEAPGSPLRVDRISRAGASWTMPVLRTTTGPFGLNLVVDYRFTRHSSNDAFYNYSSHAVGLGVTVSY